MSDKKQYELTTIQDIINVVNPDNVDAFLKDFKGFLKAAVSYNEVYKLVRSTNENAHDLPKNVTLDKMIWIDDGKNDIKMIVQSNDSNGEQH